MRVDNRVLRQYEHPDDRNQRRDEEDDPILLSWHAPTAPRSRGRNHGGEDDEADSRIAAAPAAVREDVGGLHQPDKRTQNARAPASRLGDARIESKVGQEGVACAGIHQHVGDNLLDRHSGERTYAEGSECGDGEHPNIMYGA